MITVRPSAERGQADHGWLDTRFSFSFADYHDPEHMGFGPLRVINQDVIAPGQGFGMHPHRDMEIVTYVLEGALAHRDSAGNEGVIRPGVIQRMSAGRGILHSEFNASQDEPVHLLQIWIQPAKMGAEPRYEDREFAAGSADRLRLLVSPDGADGSLDIHQDARMYDARLAAGGSILHPLAPGRRAWLQLLAGELALNGAPVAAGDGAAVELDDALEIKAVKAAHFLLFDLP